MSYHTEDTTASPSTASPSAPSAPDPKTSREAIARAVQARLSGGGSGSSPSEAEQYQQKKEEREFSIQLRRVVDMQIKRDNTYEKAAECFRTLSTIVNNILQHPTEKKYRSFRAENARIQRCILSVPGGRDFLIKTGFRVRPVEFKEEWFFPDEAQPPPTASSPTSTSTSAPAGYNKLWRHLELAAATLRDVTVVAEERASAKREREQREEHVEKQRVAVALAEARADREKVAQRAARERLIREHREKQEREEAEVAAARVAAIEGGGGDEGGGEEGDEAKDEE